MPDMNSLPSKEISAGKDPGNQLTQYVPAHPPRAPARLSPGAETSHGMTPRQVLDAVRYWWKLALPAGILLAGAAAAVVYLTFEPMYQASYWIRIEERVPFIAFETRENEQSKAFVQTQVELLRSPMVLGPAIFGRKEDPKDNIATVPEIAKEDDKIAWLAKEIKVKQVGSSELFNVSYAGPNPEDAAKIVNAVVDSYFKLREGEESRRMGRVIELLEKERTRRLDDVKGLRENVRELAKQVTGKDPFVGTKEAAPAQARPLTDLENRLVTAEVDEEILKAKLTAFEELAAKPRVEVPSAAIEKAITENAQVQKAAAEIGQKKARLAQIESTVTQGKNAPQYQQLSRGIADEEQALETFKAALRKQTKEQLAITLNGKREEELAALRSDLESRKITKKLIQDRYDRELKSAKGYSGDALSLKFKQDELAREERVFELISERIVKLNTEQGAPARVTRMTEKLDAPTAPVQSVPYMRLILAMLGGLVAPFGLVVLKEQMNRRVTDSDYLEQQAHLAVIGEIARLPTRSATAQHHLGRRDRRAVRLFEESVDALRTNLLLSNHPQPFRVLAVTSATKREGKTSVAVQLAVSIARASKELTLVIDGDMRAPSVHRVFEVPLEPGLSKVLSGECQLKDAILPTWSENVNVLPAGSLSASPHTLLANGAFGTLLESISDDYRYVIIDTPPVLAASESLVLAKASDALLLCVMRDVSRVSQVRKATDRLIAAGGRLAGTVLSGVPVSQYVHRYGSYPYPEE